MKYTMLRAYYVIEVPCVKICKITDNFLHPVSAET